VKPRVKPIQYIVIHHSAANDAYVDAADLIDERKRRSEGYNYIIDDDTAPSNKKVHASLQDVPDGEISNGTYGINGIAWNVCVNGNFELRQPSSDEIAELIQVIASKAKRWGWRKGDVHRIITHNEAGRKYSEEYYVTACPGRFMIAKVPYIRERVATYLPE
jgi:hypothetical protein